MEKLWFVRTPMSEDHSHCGLAMNEDGPEPTCFLILVGAENKTKAKGKAVSYWSKHDWKAYECLNLNNPFVGLIVTPVDHSWDTSNEKVIR